MNFRFDNDRPIYIQLVEQLKLWIVSGTLQPGVRLPSVRDLALSSKVNPNTMQKALVELENQGFIYTERTNGKFVTTNQELIECVKKELAKKNAQSYLFAMSTLGISKKEAIIYLQEEGEENNGITRIQTGI